MKKRITLIPLFLIMALFFMGCSNPTPTPTQSNKLTVYTSFAPMYDFTKSIAKDKVNIVNFVPSGVEPHDFEPSAKDIASVSNADVFVYSGNGMEGFIDKLKSTVGDKVLFVEASIDIPTVINEQSATDPHVWLSPLNAKQQIKNIADALILKDPENAQFYTANLEESTKKFDNLHQQYKDTIATLTDKNLVVAHNAYAYLCKEYGLTQVALDGISDEPSPAQLAKLSDFCKANNVKTIFFSATASPKIAQTLASETGATAAVLDPFESQLSLDYYTVMTSNLEALKQGLQ